MGAKSLAKHGGEQIWATALARSASLSEDEGLWFVSCVQRLGGCGKTGDGQREVPVMKGLFLILCFIMGFLQNNFF